ncbi:MAG: Crp/Fnr family transcriptional regulator [Candidatus Pelagadaptatus aseana]|uniref:Crp/Fnr family transcriptional regulator n=1 Tax=Candidatus Pelagadaptatus aseana TaxID=3120508 RepID=UPI0039B215CB
MDNDTLLQALSRNPGFAALDIDYRREIVQVGRVRQLPAGGCVFRQDEAVDGVYCLLQGQVHAVKNLADGREQLIVYRVRSGWFGEVSALDLNPRSFTMRASTDLEYFHIPQPAFEALLGNDLGRARFFISELCHRTRVSYEYGSDALALDAAQRLAKVLQIQYDNVRLANPEVSCPGLSCSQEDLACMVGVSRQRINRILKSWQAEGCIELSRSHIRLTDVAALQRLSNGVIEGAPQGLTPGDGH